MNNLIEMFSYAFITRAFIVGIIISLCASLIGVSLVLRKNSMIGDGLSHVGFGAFAIATVFGFAPLEFSIPLVIIASFFILKTSNESKINGDARIAIISASALAFGTFIISVTKGVNTDINTYLFGSILSVGEKDLIISVILGIIVMIVYIFSYNKIFAITFDETFAKGVGIDTDFYNTLFGILCSVTVVLGMRLMGSLLISSLIIFPAISSMMVFKKFKSTVICSAILSVITFTLGLISSYILEVPTGATIVLANLLILITFKLFSTVKR